ELATVEEPQHDQRGHRLGQREAVHQRVTCPLSTRVRVGEPAPQIDDGFAVPDDAHRGTCVVTVGKPVGQQFVDACEASVTATVRSVRHAAALVRPRFSPASTSLWRSLTYRAKSIWMVWRAVA